MTVGSRRSGLNQNIALKEQYERALQDLTDLVDTAKDKIAADQRIVASSVEEVQNHLDKHKVAGQRLPSTVTSGRQESIWASTPQLHTHLIVGYHKAPAWAQFHFFSVHASFGLYIHGWS